MANRFFNLDDVKKAMTATVVSLASGRARSGGRVKMLWKPAAQQVVVEVSTSPTGPGGQQRPAVESEDVFGIGDNDVKRAFELFEDKLDPAQK